jgi:hypothetical protein
MPAKDNTKRNNRSAYSKNPIRIGESYNLMAAISGALLAEYNIFMRSSTLGRRSLQSILETEGNPLEIKRLKVQDNYVNANADILNAKLKSIGIKIELIKEGDDEPDMLYDAIMPLYIGKYVIYDSPLKKPMYNQLFRAFDKYVGSIDVVESYEGEKEDLAWKYVFDLPEIKELDIPDFIKEMVNKASKNHSEPITENPDDFNESEGE